MDYSRLTSDSIQTGQQQPGYGAASSPFGSPRLYWLTLLLLVALTVADGVLVNVLFDMYTERYAQFINQGTAFVYIIWSGLILLYRRCTASPRAASGEPCACKKQWLILVVIGIFNGSGNFCMAIGQPHTPGLTQSLLSLTQIPLVMGLSWACLRKRASGLALAGALLIVGGSCASGLRVLYSDGGAAAPIVSYWYSIAIFAGGQLFLSGEKVFEEHSFGRYKRLDPMDMFFVTLVTQFMLGWLLYPVQTVEAFGGLKLGQIPSVIVDGVQCTFGVTAAGQVEEFGTAGAGGGSASGSASSSDGVVECSLSNTLIFFVYCSVDFWCYFFGLYVIQRGGANLMVLASAISLPVQQLVLCTAALMGKWVESFFVGDAVALVLVLAGFLVFQLSAEARKGRSVGAVAQGNAQFPRNSLQRSA